MTDIDRKLRSELEGVRVPELGPLVEARLSSRPTSDHIPGRAAIEPRSRSRVAAAVLAFAVFGASAAFAWLALRPTGPSIVGSATEAVVTLTEPGPNETFPAAVLRVGASTQQGKLSDFLWEGANVSMPTVPDVRKFIQVPEGSELVIQGTATSVAADLGDPAQRYPLEKVRSLDLEDGTAMLDVTPGRYVLILVAHWPQGSVPFYFGIEIVEAAASDAAPETIYAADALVLDDPGREPVMCVGGVADSLPPQCDGIPIVGWDWDAVEGEERASGSTWGSFHLVGTYDGTTFTVLETGPYEHAEPSEGDPVDTPCAEPDGGWTSPDPSKASDADLRNLMHAVEDEPDFAGFWIDYLAEPIGEDTVEPGGVIVNVAFTGDLERHTAEIRDRWGGPLCVVHHERTLAELRRIQRELGDAGGLEAGLDVMWSSIDVQDNVVELGVIVADEAARVAVDAKYGPGAVELHPALKPVS